MEEDNHRDDPSWNPDFFSVLGFTNTYDHREDVIRTQDFLKRVYKGESLETLIIDMTEQHIDPFTLYFNQCVPFREAYPNADVPFETKLVVTPGIQDMLREASDDRNETTAFIGGLMGALGFSAAALSGYGPFLLLGPVVAVGTYSLFRFGQHFTKSGKSKVFADYLEKSYDITSSFHTHNTSKSGCVYHEITRNISKYHYLIGGHVMFYPSWYYKAEQYERYFLTEGSLDKEPHVDGLAISVKDGFLPSLTVGSFHSYNTIWIGIAVLVGVFVDLDHPIKHFLLTGEFNPKKAWNAGLVKHENDRTFIHHKEGILMITFFFIIFYAYFPYWTLAVALGYYSHMLLDHFSLAKGFIDNMTTKLYWGKWKPYSLIIFGFDMELARHEIAFDLLMIFGLITVIL